MRHQDTKFEVRTWLFQSTHPVWDATLIRRTLCADSFDFNPRIPYGMRQCASHFGCVIITFQSTHPVWDATLAGLPDHAHRSISIHASRMGCDESVPAIIEEMDAFQSTHPVWDATIALFDMCDFIHISIHASRMGCDPTQSTYRIFPSLFQSTHPVWDATILSAIVITP